MKISQEIFKSFVTAVMEFSNEVNRRILKYVYFEWEEAYVAGLLDKYEMFFKSISQIL